MTTAILLATYQGAAYLDAFLASLAAQTDQDFTCYIHDDGSTDETFAETGRGKTSKFERVRFYRKHHIDRSHGTAWMMWWV